MMQTKKMIRMVTLLLGMVMAVTAGAAEKPFAEHKVVLQISEGDPARQTLVLNVANNLVSAYGIDHVDVQVVAFGPGLGLLLEENANKGRIKSLVENADVKFHACKNTIANMARKQGAAPHINPLATTDSGGVERILALRGQGYELIKP